MKTFITLFILITFSQTSLAENPYLVLGESYKDTPGSEIEILESTPIKTQDGIGICYGFTSTSLLETYRCREMSLDCSKPEEALSTFDVTSYFRPKDKNVLDEGGHSSEVLKHLKEQGGVVAREQCMPFSSIIQQEGSVNVREKKGMNFLTGKWNEYKGIKNKKPNDCITCMVNDIRKALSNLGTSNEELADAFKTAGSLEEFLYLAVLPKECLQESKTAKIPEYEVNSFPTALKDANPKTLQKKIESLLLSKIPLEIGICADSAYTKNCKGGEGHSIALYGIKESCSATECKTVVKVKNSYGESWQKKTNDGWVDLEELVKSSLSISDYKNVNWINKPGAEIPDVEMKYSK
ncbi:hypothetical protein SHI21_18860 [Bacteriovorax sp. PP10]|uniref:Papain family cysteine protease n=1 Tax=Bacteriovorax antarcticus TaxID=3088717 RepID=A0ABU5W199_9BACT|nr:hypothetical protein [Bacteriovorax sp. PP10]MEA9358304.1 hypothetical protein [Bacteriovorax sp. PP10]